MPKITEAQIELLGRAAAEPDGVIYGPEDATLARALIIKRLAIWLTVEGGGERLIITEKGRAALPAPRSRRAACTAERVEVADTSPRGAGLAAGGAGKAASAPAETPGPQAKLAPAGKLGALVDLLNRPQGATVDDMMAATGWQAHSVRGALAGALKKTLGYEVASERVYRIVDGSVLWIGS
jgi:Protein of unknown function (DUF3489)